MAGISSVQAIVASIRAELAQRGGAARPRKRVKAEAATSARTLISRRVSELDAADPQRGRKAFRIFLESVLLDELGQELINDTAFYALVDQVQQTMEQDEPTAAAIEQAVALLLGQQAR